MKTKKNKVGSKPKYANNIETITIHVLIPKEVRADCLNAIEKIVQPYKY